MSAPEERPEWLLLELPAISDALDRAKDDEIVLVVRDGDVRVLVKPWAWLTETTRTVIEGWGLRPGPWPTRLVVAIDAESRGLFAFECESRAGRSVA